MSLAALDLNELALIGRALRFMAAGNLLQQSEFSTRIGVELPAFQEMVARRPAWDDSSDESPEFIVSNNTLNELLHGVNFTEKQCVEIIGAGRAALLDVYGKWGQRVDGARPA